MSYASVLGLIFVAGIVYGIKLMSSPRTAVKGNLLGSVCMAGAIILTLLSEGIVGIPTLWIAMAVGSAIGYWLAIKVAMIQMPQMVALLNGLGGGGSALVSLMVLLETLGAPGPIDRFTAALGLIVGAVTLSGSIVAALKLHGRMNQRPIIFKGQTELNSLVLAAIALLVTLIVAFPRAPMATLSFTSLAISLAFGVIFTIRVGGADMPVTISLLNSFSGVAGAISGFAVYNPLLIAIGAVVGASGLILTQIMCRAMNRSLAQVLSGRTVLIAEKPTVPTAAVAPEIGTPIEALDEGTRAQEDAASILNEAKSVIIVPGYGMALAQAQHQVKKLMEKLEEKGADVRFAIHPVAGRMPGHMNVLLAEADIEYDKLCEMEDINDSFEETDLVIVIGACDVVNPAANTAVGTPIYGMPVLNVEDAGHIFILNMDTKPGYSGVDNPLYESPKARLFLGDANGSVAELLTLLGAQEEPAPAVAPVEECTRHLEALRDAKKVIIVPGYGMALAQAQFKVKLLIEALEARGAEVKVGIHPVAGRMPGHMNVLLAEADVPYDKLFEMDEINSEFKESDVAVVVGANDVVNPAANTAAGTPIYGMPILLAHEAGHVVVFNLDTKPGYAGVDNPLYTQDNVTLLLGDASTTIAELIEQLA